MSTAETDNGMRKKRKTRNVITASLNIESMEETPTTFEIDEDDYKTVDYLFRKYRDAGYQVGYREEDVEEDEDRKCIGIKEDAEDRRISELVWQDRVASPEEIEELSEELPAYLLPAYLPCFASEIGNLTSLESLRLKYSALHSFPRSIGNLTNLRVLILNHTVNFHSVPEEFGNLTSLKVIQIGESTFESLPLPICNLSNLEELGLISFEDWSHNLRNIPNEIQGLTNLKTLTLSGTKIDTLPDIIGNLSNLKNLSLCKSPINSLPDIIGNLTNLEVLDLSQTEIDSLPDTIGNLANLEVLDLAYSLDSLPDTIGNLTNLKVLNLAYSPIASLPNSICNLVNLKELDLFSADNLKSLPHGLENFIRLELLNLRSSGILTPSIPTAIRKMKNLKIMHLGRGFFSSDHEETLLKLLKDCPRLGCIGEYFGCTRAWDCECPGCGGEKVFEEYYRGALHPQICNALSCSLVWNKARSRICYSPNFDEFSFPPLSFLPLVFEKMANAGDYGVPSVRNPGNFYWSEGCNLLPQADGIFKFLVEFGERILSRACSRNA